MTSEEFGKRYLQHEQDIANVLRDKKIYDEDLVHDTYIALYEYSQQEEIRDFVSTFVEFYKRLDKRREKDAGYFETCDNATMIEKYDRIDEDDWEYREYMEKMRVQMDKLLIYFQAHPFSGERNHERACEILSLFSIGLSNVEIAKSLKIDESTVRRYIKRAIKVFKSPSNLTII